MIHLGYVFNDVRLSPPVWNRLSVGFPVSLLKRIESYHRWQDRQASLYGKLLLDRMAGLLLGQRPDLARLQYDRYQRPYFLNSGEFDFNISHTEGLVVCGCAVGHGRIGVDVERLKPVDVGEFVTVFTQEELMMLRGSPRIQRDFYRLWTRKEAVMKADGRGFHLDASSIDSLAEPVTIGDNRYTTSWVDVGPDHMGHVAARGDFRVCLHPFTPTGFLLP